MGVVNNSDTQPKMKVFDKKTITLNDGTNDLNVLVYLKEVNVRNNNIKTRAFCRVIE